MSTPVPGGQPELTGQVMFYKRPEPLSLEKHRNLGVKQVAAPFSFLKTAHAVPITVSEFGVAATCFPIIFVGPDKTPVAVMGVRQNEHDRENRRFVREQGTQTGGFEEGGESKF